MTKVIFLDIDGVLNCRKTPNPRKFPYVIDEGLLARFTQLLQQTGASVVLSSTWRYDPAGIFSAKHQGVSFIDITPDMPDEPRCKEILEWLRVHLEVTRYVVICQSALDWDPLSASKRDPFERRVRPVALAPSELAGVAETVRARVV